MTRFLERMRPRLFWTADRLRGGAVRSAYSDIQFIQESPDRAAADARQAGHLEALLRHATATTPFFRKYAGAAGLQDFPVINKNLIREKMDSFRAETFRGQALFETTTSGSTGTPFTVLQDPGKRARHQADNIYFCALAGYPIGSRLYYLRVWNQINHKGALTRFVQNIVTQETSDLSDGNLAAFLDDLRRDGSSKSLLAFASSYEVLAQYLVRNPAGARGIKVETLMAMSEALPTGSRDLLREAFGCPVICRYSNMENGFIAQQCVAEGNEYHLNRASYVVELLDLERDEAVPPGTMGRIVVTDLFNYAMPMIRYDTGDTAILAETAQCGLARPVLAKVEGRRAEFLYDTQGRLRSSYIITNSMWKFTEVRQFQFIQEGAGDFLMRLNCGGSGFKREAELLADLRAYLGEDARIAFEYVAEIPVLASGKRKKIINNYRKP